MPPRISNSFCLKRAREEKELSVSRMLALSRSTTTHISPISRCWILLMELRRVKNAIILLRETGNQSRSE